MDKKEKPNYKRPRYSHRNNNTASKRELIEALKVAFQYMPFPEEITVDNYGNEKEMVETEVNKVHSALRKLNIEPAKLYEEMNAKDE